MSQECVTVHRPVNECTDSYLRCGTSKDSPTALQITSVPVWTLKIPTKPCFLKDKLWTIKAAKSFLNRERARRVFGQGGT